MLKATRKSGRHPLVDGDRTSGHPWATAMCVWKTAQQLQIS